MTESNTESRLQSMPEVTIYTDGACSGNPGPGGWGAVLLWNDHQKELSGYEANTTNQRMELCAAVKALEALKRPCKVKLHSDSAYLINCFKQAWWKKWELNNWTTRGNKSVENQDLWKRLLELNEIHDIEWIKVKGHSGDRLNDRADELATGEIKGN